MKVRNLKSSKILILFYSFLLLITTSYAWMNYSEITSGKKAGLFFTEDDNNPLQITDKDLGATLYILNKKTSVYEECDSLNNLLYGIVPNDTISYRLALTNNTESMIVCDVVLYGVTTNNTKMFDYLFAGLDEVKYTSQGSSVQVDNAPSIFCDAINEIKEVKEGIYSYELIKSVPIPSNTDLTLDCFFYFDKEATLEETANSYVNISKIILAL